MKRFSPAQALILALIMPMLLSACSSGSTPTTLFPQLLATGLNSVRARQAARIQRPPLTRAALDQVEGAFIEVTIERRDQLAYLFVNAMPRDDLPGQVTVWRTEDNVTLAMRNGVLMSTRGLGGDILSASAPVRGTAPGPATGGERVFNIRARDNKELRLTLACDLSDLGPDPVVIVERRHPTRHLRERCVGPGGTITNDYWIDSHSQIVWQSRQWAGPLIGYMTIRQLTK